MSRSKLERQNQSDKITYVYGCLFLFLLVCLVGCSKREGKGESEYADGTFVYETERSGIARQLEIPDSCKVELGAGDSGLDSILIDVDEIKVPETDQMEIAYFSTAKVTSDTKKNLSEMVFDKNDGIYKYDDDHMTKQDYKLKIEHIKNEIKGSGDTYLDSNAMIKEWEKKASEAPDTYEAAGDYDADGFLGIWNGEWYTLSFMDTNEAFYGTTVTLKLHSEDDTGTWSIRPIEGTDNAYCTYDAVDLTEENQSDMTQEVAESAANEFIYQIEREDMLETSVEPLQWVYRDEYFQELMTQNDGYVVRFSKAIGQIPMYKAGLLYYVNNLSEILSSAEFQVPEETCDVYVYNGEVIQAQWHILYEKASEGEKNVQLLSFQDMLDKAQNGLTEYYKKYPTKYSKVEFNHLELGYYVISDGEDIRKAIPAWIFSSYDENTEFDASMELEEFAVVNAIDGMVVDIVEEGKRMGYYLTE